MRDRGAHFHRTDLQVHTPRDNQWSGDRPVDDVERRAFADEFVAACRQKSLHAVAITDHHDFAFFRHIREAAQQETKDDGDPLEDQDRLVVFPGLELTLGVPCQALLILDADLPIDRLPDVLAALSIEPVRDAAPALPPVVPLDHFKTLGAVHDQLDLRDGLRGRYTLLPNVTDGGHQTLMRKGMSAQYKEMPCVGGYIDGTVDNKVGRGNADIFAGKDKNRGNKRLALFQTSDNRSGTFEKLGEPSTWIKWSEPTAEALRQACLAEESRISQGHPGLPSVYIERLSVSNSKFMGPVELALNPQYNAIIGGRGTGKSSLLAYMRWALCDQGPSTTADEDTNDHVTRLHRLIDATLKPLEATVDVHFALNGIAHVVRRSSATGDVQLKIGENEFGSATPSEIRHLLPVQAYSQKQLSTVSVRIDELTSFVTMPIRRTLQDIDARIKDTSGRIRETYAALQRHRQLDQNVRRITTQLQSSTDQAESLRRSLTGLSDGDQEILNAKQKFDGASAALDGWSETWVRTERLVARFEEVLAEQIIGIQDEPEAPDEFTEKFTQYRAQLVDALRSLESDTRSAAEAFRQRMIASQAVGDELQRVADAYSEKYEDVKQRSSAHASRLAELADLEQERQDAASLLRQETAARDELGDPASDLIRLRSELLDMTVERSGAVEEQCERLSELSEGLIRARLRRGQGLAAAQDAFRGFAPNSGLRSSKVEAFFDQLAAEEDPLQTWSEVLAELEELATMPSDAEVTSEAAPTTARLGLAPADLNRIVRKGSPDGWLSLALTPVEDHPVFEYRTRDADYIAFSDASAGQQATALMRVLLADAGPPLMIDQPEDDLDSQVIQDIVGRLWTAKRNRQLVFASHNANLVVNGDADLVVGCDYRVAGDQSGGRVKIEGAIDQAAVRTEIATVMEGGEKAFRLRKEKYGF